MTTKVNLTQAETAQLAQNLAPLLTLIGDRVLGKVRLYGIPRGGVSAAYLLIQYLSPRYVIVDNPENADIFIDDIIDSGETMRKYCDQYPGVPFFALIDKTNPGCGFRAAWIVFPWETADDSGIESNITRILQYVGENPNRGGLLETPRRVAKAWGEWTSGYSVDIPALIKSFEDGAEGCDEMVVRQDIPLYSHCEHHMAAIFGSVTVAYIPDTKVVGLSKMDRLVDAFGRRLQVQERLTNQIADALYDNLKPRGVGVIVKARHMCIESRGVKNANSMTRTSALRGVFKDQAETRAEFLSLAR